MKSACRHTVFELAVLAVGVVACGSEQAAPVAQSSVGPSARPYPVKIAAYSFSACALMTDGTVRCWGDNQAGQLGHACDKGLALGFSSWHCFVAAPVYGDDTLEVPFDGVVDIAVGGLHALAIRTDGSAWCWGDNLFGDCGTGDKSDAIAFPPVRTLLEDVVELSPGSFPSCAMLADHSLWCWGAESGGPMLATPVPSPWVDQIAALPPHSPLCIVLPDQGVSCRGPNLWGEVGDGTFEDRETYTPVVGIDDAVQVARSGRRGFSCALRASGDVACWGLGGFLGDGTTTDSPTPVAVQLPGPAETIAAGISVACAITEDRTVWCWGSNLDGAIGDGTEEDRPTPVQVVGLDDAVQIALGSGFSCALRSDHTVWCWGNNHYGQLGSGYKDGPRGEDYGKDSPVPVRVVFEDALEPPEPVE